MSARRRLGKGLQWVRHEWIHRANRLEPPSQPATVRPSPTHARADHDAMHCECADPSQYLPACMGADGLPSLSLVDVEELVDIVAARNDCGHEAAERAVRRGALYAGYQWKSDQVTAADAFDIVEEALRFRV